MYFIPNLAPADKVTYVANPKKNEKSAQIPEHILLRQFLNAIQELSPIITNKLKQNAKKNYLGDLILILTSSKYRPLNQKVSEAIALIQYHLNNEGRISRTYLRSISGNLKVEITNYLNGYLAFMRAEQNIGNTATNLEKIHLLLNTNYEKIIKILCEQCQHKRGFFSFFLDKTDHRKNQKKFINTTHSIQIILKQLDTNPRPKIDLLDKQTISENDLLGYFLDATNLILNKKEPENTEIYDLIKIGEDECKKLSHLKSDEFCKKWNIFPIINPYLSRLLFLDSFSPEKTLEKSNKFSFSHFSSLEKSALVIRAETCLVFLHHIYVKNNPDPFVKSKFLDKKNYFQEKLNDKKRIFARDIIEIYLNLHRQICKERYLNSINYGESLDEITMNLPFFESKKEAVEWYIQEILPEHDDKEPERFKGVLSLAYGWSLEEYFKLKLTIIERGMLPKIYQIWLIKTFEQLLDEKKFKAAHTLINAASLLEKGLIKKSYYRYVEKAHDRIRYSEYITNIEDKVKKLKENLLPYDFSEPNNSRPKDTKENSFKSLKEHIKCAIEIIKERKSVTLPLVRGEFIHRKRIITTREFTLAAKRIKKIGDFAQVIDLSDHVNNWSNLIKIPPRYRRSSPLWQQMIECNGNKPYIPLSDKAKSLPPYDNDFSFFAKSDGPRKLTLINFLILLEKQFFSYVNTFVRNEFLEYKALDAVKKFCLETLDYEENKEKLSRGIDDVQRTVASYHSQYLLK